MDISEVRRQRDMMLAATDWWAQTPDYPFAEGEREAWLTYRQALRDITNLESFSDENDFWPLPPKRYVLLDGCTTINLPSDYVDQY